MSIKEISDRIESNLVDMQRRIIELENDMRRLRESLADINVEYLESNL